MGRKIDLTGKTFGRLTVIEESPKRTINGDVYWVCKCTCGGTTVVDSSSLRRGLTKSCGCLPREKMIALGHRSAEWSTKHGMHNKRIYRCWDDMIKRCYNPKCNGYHIYGGRGIKVCDEWRTFQNFYDWAKENGYTDELTLDRIDNDGNYEPSNCRWATVKFQNRNKRNNVYVTYKGEKKCLMEWSETLGIKYEPMRKRNLESNDPEYILFGVRNGSHSE